MLSIVNDTLDFTGIQDGTLYLEKERYSVLSVLQDLVTYGNFNAEKKKLDFRVEMSEELPQELSRKERRALKKAQRKAEKERKALEKAEKKRLEEMKNTED